jgi:hypothetical protein
MLRSILTTALAVIATASPAAAVTDKWRPCEYEDGSSQRRCVWDARHMGNGVGRSLIIFRGGTARERIVYISHRKAHWLMTDVQPTVFR